jgi:phage protein U
MRVNMTTPASEASGLRGVVFPETEGQQRSTSRLQRWRATVARHDGAAVSFHVAPPTRT